MMDEISVVVLTYFSVAAFLKSLSGCGLPQTRFTKGLRKNNLVDFV